MYSNIDKDKDNFIHSREQIETIYLKIPDEFLDEETNKIREDILDDESNIINKVSSLYIIIYKKKD